MQITETQLDRIAKLSVQGLPNDDICAIMHLDGEQLEEIKQHQLYKEKEAALFGEKLDTFETINDGLDNIELLTLNQILTYLQCSTDPDFALKALAVVNRATRRGHVNNKPLGVPNGNRTTIDLSQHFVLALQDGRNGQTEKRPANVLENIQQKVIDSLPIEKVERMLEHSEPVMQQMLLAESE